MPGLSGKSLNRIGLGVNWLFSGNRKKWFDRIAGTAYLAFALGLATADLRRA